MTCGSVNSLLTKASLIVDQDETEAAKLQKENTVSKNTFLHLAVYEAPQRSIWRAPLDKRRQTLNVSEKSVFRTRMVEYVRLGGFISEKSESSSIDMLLPHAYAKCFTFISCI